MYKILTFLLLIILSCNLNGKENPRATYFNKIVEFAGSEHFATTRVDAAKMFGEIGDSSALDHLTKLLEDKRDRVKIESAFSMYRLGDKSGLPIIVKIFMTKPKLSDKPTPVEHARILAKGTVRVRAAELIGETGDKSYLPMLQQMTKDDDGRVADKVLISLAKLGDRSGVKVFISGLDSSDPYIRVQACRSLGEVKEEIVVQKFRRLLDYWNKDVKAEACIALGKIKDEESTEKIAKLLHDSEVAVRMAACESLGLMGNKEFIPQLQEALKDEHGLVRLSACEALMRLGDHSGDDFLLYTLETTDIDARLKAVKTLADFGKKDAIEGLEKHFDKENDEIIKLNICGAIVRILDREGLLEKEQEEKKKKGKKKKRKKRKKRK